MKDVKGLLKEARDAIKQKDYESSLKLCKQILKDKNDNYTALVFLAVSYQETGQSQQSLDTFKKAIEVETANPLAWSGLINFYEKNDQSEYKPDLVKTYLTLLQIETNEKKLIEFVQKLVPLYKYGDVSEITEAIYNLIKSGKVEEVSGMWVALVDLFLKIHEATPENLLPIKEEALTLVLSNQKTISIEYYSEFLSLLYKKRKIEKLLEEAKKMHLLFEMDTNSLIWICKVYNECYIENRGKKLESDENIKKYQENLLKLEQKSPTALLTQSLHLFEDGKLLEATDLVKFVVKSCPGLLHAWIFLARICVRLHLGNEAVQAINKIEKLSKSTDKSEIILLKIQSLVETNEKDDFQSALELFNTGICNDEELKNKALQFAIKACINLKKFEQTKLLLSDFSKIPDHDEATLKLLTAQFYHKQHELSKALTYLDGNDDVSSCDWWIEIGQIYWDNNEKDKSLIPFLKAAKLEPFNYKCFLLLGHYYNEVNDPDKARRCYEKAFKINNQSAEVGIELSKIYRKLKNWDANVALLQSLTAGIINKGNCWAWIQLGLNYLEQEDYEKAVNTLRFVIRIEENNAHCWESLADVYLAKGAYTSALKCYAKASELQTSSSYPLLQMAAIKQILGEFTEAKADFDQVLLSNGEYVPALKGIAETCMHQARDCKRIQRLGKARDHAQFAANKLIVAIQQRADLSCLWKLLGDCCVFVAKLPEKNCCLLLQQAFVDGLDLDRSKNKIVEKEELYTLGTRCYCKSLSLIEDNALIWHDLSACFLSHALNTENDDFAELMDKAEACALHCVETNPIYWQHWNLLANIAFNKNPPNYKLVQHSLIKAVTADNNSAVSWCNLGTLYLILGDFKLANEAFSQAQRADPNYVNSWIGQAILAENFNHEDAMDLFRHSTQLGMHLQGALGYGHWVCRTLKNSPPDSVIYSIHNMHAIPVACDNLTWFTENNPENAAAWNMLGMLRERLGLVQGSLEAFKNALVLTCDRNKDRARVNYGRLLEKVGKLQESVNAYAQVKEASKESVTGLALALFKAQHYEESYETYNQALHWLADDENSQSDLLVALASMAYKFQGSEPATTLLFQSIQLEKPSPWGFYATLALGLLRKDFSLAKLVFNEKLQAIKDQRNCLQHYATLTAFLYLLQKESKKAVTEISKLVHRHPDQACVWLTLATVLVRIQTKQSKAAAKCAQISMTLGQNTMDVTKVLCLVSLASFVSGEVRNSLIAAQKAVHCYPNISESWAMLGSVLSTDGAKIVNSDKVGAFFQLSQSLSTSKELSDWLENAMRSL